MSSDRTRTREAGTDDVTEFDVDLSGEKTGGAERPDDPGSGLRERVGGRAKRLFSPRAFLVALLLSVVGLVGTSALIPLLPGAGLPGVFLATFLFGLAAERRHYLETVVAGGATVGASALLDFAVVAALGGIGVPLAAVAGGVGAVIGAVGHYFGRDLRDGLTREI